MIAVLLAALAAAGVALLAGARLERHPAGTERPSPRLTVRGFGGLAELARRRLRVDGVDAGQVALATVAAAISGTALGLLVLGAPLPALAIGAFAATGPVGVLRARAARRLAVAHEAWPRLIDEIRLSTSSLGRSIPQALFEAGRRAPVELRPAFEAAQREWLLTTDIERTVAHLKAGLADPTADATLETLLVAHELGGTGLDARLEALREDRLSDVQSRKDAQARQAGVRFARRFVLLVPFGMALAGLQIGDGRDSYGTTTGQLAVLAALAVVAGCWQWAGRLLHLPDDERVFDA